MKNLQGYNHKDMYIHNTGYVYGPKYVVSKYLAKLRVLLNGSLQYSTKLTNIGHLR